MDTGDWVDLIFTTAMLILAGTGAYHLGGVWATVSVESGLLYLAVHLSRGGR